MLLVELTDGDLVKNGGFVRIGRIAHAIAQANGAENVLDAERKIYPRINAAVQLGQMTPLHPENLTPLSKNDYGSGIVPFDELVKWGHATKLFDFKRANKTLTENQATKCPQPIKPVGDSPLKLHQFNTNVKGPANWTYWRHVATVELWQALLLSLNIEPTGGGWLVENAPGGPGDIPYEYMDSHGLTDEFISRWHLLRNRLETLYAGTDYASKVELTHFIRLPLLAAWAVEFEWEGLPPELVVLANITNEQTDMPAAVELAQTDADAPDEPVVKTGRPPTIKIKAEIVRQIIIAIESVAGEKFDTGALPGKAADLLDACKRIERSATGKILTMGTTLETFKEWLRIAGYSFPNGRAPKIQATFWTRLAPKIVGKINAEVFTGVNPEKSL